MKLHNRHSEFRSLFLLSFFATVIVFASCSRLPIPTSGDVEQEQSSDPSSNETFEEGSPTTPNSDDPSSADNDSQNTGDVPAAVQYAGAGDQDRLSALETLEPAINPMNADEFETSDTFIIPVVVGGWGGGYGRGWGRGGWGGGWGGRGWGGRGWGGRWGGGRWGGGGWGLGRWGGGGWRG